MLRGGILHPDLLRGLARCGHGSKVLVADALFPHATGARPEVERIHLNLSPGMVPATEVVRLIADACHIEAATWMWAPDGPPDAVTEYRRLLADHRHWGGQEVRWDATERLDFYDLCRAPGVALMVVTGEVRPYANLLLTIGVP